MDHRLISIADKLDCQHDTTYLRNLNVCYVQPHIGFEIWRAETSKPIDLRCSPTLEADETYDLAYSLVKSLS